MADRSVLPQKMKLLLALVALLFCYSGFHIVSRVALNIGVSKVVYPVYRNIIALLLLGPFAYFFEKKERPPLTFSVLVQLFFLALLGLEKVNISRRDGLAKVLGTIASIGGASVITLYKGPPLLHQITQQEQGITSEEDMSSKQNAKLDLGMHIPVWALLIMGWLDGLSGKAYFAPVLKKYPAKLSVTSFTCLFGLIQFLVIAAFVETDVNHWKIQSGEELFTILYAGIVSSAIVISLQTWCIHKGGPVFVAVFQPMQTILVAIMASLILGDQLYSGGIIGAVLIMLGLYSVLWGKIEEKRVEIQNREEPLARNLLEDKNKDKEEGPCIV
ncbi:hypothetical protein NC652_034652 [Populus alba x Populus x berolinensis]|nr:hypothetical protein NC652_034652 [Populus alba x Populus x berolinensis]